MTTTSPDYEAVALDVPAATQPPAARDYGKLCYCCCLATIFVTLMLSVTSVIGIVLYDLLSVVH